MDWPQGKVGSGKKSVGKTGGDHGDPDLRAALDKVPGVVVGLLLLLLLLLAVVVVVVMLLNARGMQSLFEEGS